MNRWLNLALVLLLSASAAAQTPDTVRLGALYDDAVRTDPRYRQLDLHEDITSLTLSGLATARRPQLDLSARASWQNETVSFPFDGSSVAFAVPTPPKDQYEVAGEIGQLLYDGRRIAAEETLARRRLAERTAEVDATLYQLRPEINAAFFAALLHQEQQAQLDVLADDLEAKRRLVAAQARDGAALPSDASALEAELIYVRQRMAAAEAARRAALRRLELLTSRSIDAGDVLAVPDVSRVDGDVLQATALAGAESRRPEFDRFDRARERALAEAEAVDAAVKPRISAFARVAVGRPGYDFFDDTIRPYGMVGLRAQWSPFDWNATAYRSEATRLQEDVIAAEEAAFEARLSREVLDARYAIERLEAVLASDAHAIALRERVARTASRQLEEGVLLAAEYVRARNDVFEARLQERIHSIELAEARVRMLTILGRDLPDDDAGLHQTIAPAVPYSLLHDRP